MKVSKKDKIIKQHKTFIRELKKIITQYRNKVKQLKKQKP